ncbi:flagellar motor switch protein FliG [uncultured Sphingorhabdus sp.]|uniref:flagellar motor switch protein FliG n=1 Tax=uncultured Sphingorhabdus sp. TaxID=1686106 RepID=UPI00261DCA0D|nr:flagellar motor switch protein FliG [uncultured Sphingorhabdus sp.]HMS19821.1 flagellar motor switch protein FliG [Sphingorhabdus sp.]
MEAEGKPQIGGASAAAILMLLLEEKEAADVLRHLDPDEVRQLGSEMFGAAEADESKVDLALGRFVSGSREVSALTPGADRKIRNVMTDALGDDRAGSLLSSIAPQPQRDALERLRWMETETIADVINAEHPQVGAVLLSMLAPDIAAAVLAGFSGERQADLLWRAARLGPVHAEAIDDLEETLAEAEAASAKAITLEIGGQSDVAKIVNSLPRTVGEELLKAMRKKDKLLAAAIEDEMFVFEDLNQLDAKSLGAVLRGVEAATLALALKGAEGALADRFLATMSARAADTIRDELAEMAPVKREEVDAARKAIVAIARAMAVSGEIMLGGKGDDYV